MQLEHGQKTEDSRMKKGEVKFLRNIDGKTRSIDFKIRSEKGQEFRDFRTG